MVSRYRIVTTAVIMKEYEVETETPIENREQAEVAILGKDLVPSKEDTIAEVVGFVEEIPND